MEIDILRRMHSAEHLLNGTMVQRFGCNRSFSAHLNKKKTKCDYHFDRNLTEKEIGELNSQINQQIERDLPVFEEMMERKEADRLFDLSRLPDAVGDNLRVIRMGDYDVVPCIGNHVEHTAQIGMFRIISSSYENDVLRIRFKLYEKT